jgi:hypothetical protein
MCSNVAEPDLPDLDIPATLHRTTTIQEANVSDQRRGYRIIRLHPHHVSSIP